MGRRAPVRSRHAYRVGHGVSEAGTGGLTLDRGTECRSTALSPSAKHVARLAALAVAVGLGTAVATPAVASAEETGSASSSESGPTSSEAHPRSGATDPEPAVPGHSSPAKSAEPNSGAATPDKRELPAKRRLASRSKKSVVTLGDGVVVRSSGGARTAGVEDGAPAESAVEVVGDVETAELPGNSVSRQTSSRWRRKRWHRSTRPSRSSQRRPSQRRRIRRLGPPGTWTCCTRSNSTLDRSPPVSPTPRHHSPQWKPMIRCSERCANRCRHRSRKNADHDSAAAPAGTGFTRAGQEGVGLLLQHLHHGGAHCPAGRRPDQRIPPPDPG